jgi:hypothetical protein
LMEFESPGPRRPGLLLGALENAGGQASGLG